MSFTETNEQRVARGLLDAGKSFELMGRTEAARELGVRPGNLTQVAGLPAPLITYLVRWPLWLASDIREFAIKRSSR